MTALWPTGDLSSVREAQMPFVDLPQDQLRALLPHLTVPTDLRPFSNGMLEQCHEHAVQLTWQDLDSDAVRVWPHIDARRSLLYAISQRGGFAPSVDSLAGDTATVRPDATFRCNIPIGLEIAEARPNTDITADLAVHWQHAEAAIRRPAPFDNAAVVRWASAHAKFTPLRCQTCPPSTCFAAYGADPLSKEIIVFPCNDREGGQAEQQASHLPWPRRQLEDGR